MTPRPPRVFDTAHAEHVHDVLCDLVPGIGVPVSGNPLGVEMASIAPLVRPIRDVLDGLVHDDVRVGVYVVVDHRRVVRYVGSVHRAAPALRSRLRTHLSSRGIVGRWTGVVLIRLPEEYPHRDVLACEGWVGRVMDPLDNERLPAVGGKPWCPRPLASVG